MKFKFTSSIIKNILSKEMIKPLGRWRIEDCNKMTNYKIDSANEDHCGVCSQYAPVITEPIKDNDKEYKRYKMGMNYPDSHL